MPIVKQQVPVTECPEAWAEADNAQTPCGLSINLGPSEGRWFCTRPQGHPLGPHVAHYDADVEMVGVAWTTYRDF